MRGEMIITSESNSCPSYVNLLTVHLRGHALPRFSLDLHSEGTLVLFCHFLKRATSRAISFPHFNIVSQDILFASSLSVSWSLCFRILLSINNPSFCSDPSGLGPSSIFLRGILFCVLVDSILDMNNP